MQARIGTLEEGSPIVLIENEDDGVTISRMIVGKHVEFHGREFVHVHRPHMKSVYTTLDTDKYVYVT